MRGKDAHRKAIEYADKLYPHASQYSVPPKCYSPSAAEICKKWNDAHREEFNRLRALPNEPTTLSSKENE
jgi:hypothetical protein